jgi:uncharacterized membrane protein
MWAFIAAAVSAAAHYAASSGNTEASARAFAKPEDWLKEETRRLERLRSDERAVTRMGVLGGLLIVALVFSVIYAVYGMVSA